MTILATSLVRITCTASPCRICRWVFTGSSSLSPPSKETSHEARLEGPPRILYLSNILEIHLQRIEELEERLDEVVKLQRMMEQRMRVLEMKLSDIAEAASSGTEDAEEIAEDEDEEQEAPEVAWPLDAPCHADVLLDIANPEETKR